VDSHRSNGGASAFFLYLEGPHDKAILCSWARCVSRPLERVIADSVVILGGRQPARAVDHFRRESESGNASGTPTRGLCVLDRDDAEEPLGDSVPGLEFFTWPRRHIESYLLVASAIGRHANQSADVARIELLLNDGGRNLESTHAKKLLGRQGPIARELGQPISAAGVAKAMRREEIHADVHSLFDRVFAAAGIRRSDPVVVHRRAL